MRSNHVSIKACSFAGNEWCYSICPVYSLPGSLVAVLRPNLNDGCCIVNFSWISLSVCIKSLFSLTEKIRKAIFSVTLFIAFLLDFGNILTNFLF